MGQGLQTLGYEDAVFSLQWHDVCHSAETDHVSVLLQYFRLVAAEGSCQLEGHADAGEILVGVAAVGSMGIHHCHGPGEDILALMMVGDDQIDAQLPAQLRLGHSGDAAVYGDDEFDPFAVQLPDGDGVQPVALLQPPGDVADAVRPMAAQKVRQQAGGGDPVHIIVAENGHFLSPGQGETHPSGGQIHIRHQKGVQQGRVTVQVLLCLGAIPDSPGGQHHSGQWGISASYQGVDCTHFRFVHIPDSVFHFCTHPLNNIFLTL